MKNHVLYFANPDQINIMEESIPVPTTEEVLVKNIISGISAGTEMLFYSGHMPTEISLDATIPSLSHAIRYPFKYGYSSVGKIVEVGDKKLNHLIDQSVFVFNPHESFFCTRADQVILLPKNISYQDALFLSNMESAVNFILDGSPLIGENIIVLGLGVLGLLTSALLREFPIGLLIGIDLYHKRREMCLELGAELTFNIAEFNNQNKYSIDLVYELTGNPNALNSAIELACYEGRIVLGSWYGNKLGQINLGGKFHRNRIKLIASQVSTLASELHGRWTKNRRFEVALNMLQKIKPSRLISHQFHITEADKAYQLLQSNPEDALQVVLIY